MSEFELRENGEIWQRQYNPKDHNTMWACLQPYQILEILKEQEDRVKVLLNTKERLEHLCETAREYKNGIETAKKILELAKND